MSESLRIGGRFGGAVARELERRGHVVEILADCRNETMSHAGAPDGADDCGSDRCAAGFRSMGRAGFALLLALALPASAQQRSHADAIEREQQQRAQQAEALRLKTEAAAEEARPGGAPPPPISPDARRELDEAQERERRETATRQQAPSAQPEAERVWRIQLRRREESARELRR